MVNLSRREILLEVMLLGGKYAAAIYAKAQGYGVSLYFGNNYLYSNVEWNLNAERSASLTTGIIVSFVEQQI